VSSKRVPASDDPFMETLTVGGHTFRQFHVKGGEIDKQVARLAARSGTHRMYVLREGRNVLTAVSPGRSVEKDFSDTEEEYVLIAEEDGADSE
jgi:hypothetical protein